MIQVVEDFHVAASLAQQHIGGAAERLDVKAMIWK